MIRSEKMERAYKELKDRIDKECYIADLLANKNCVLYEGVEITTDNIDTYAEMQKTLSQWKKDYWQRQSTFDLKKIYPERYQRQKSMIETKFLPLYADRKSDLFDMACADGQWTAFMSAYVDHIDGYEYSNAMVQTAKKRFTGTGAKKNLDFHQADINSFLPPRQYDGGTCLGLLTYVTDASLIARKLYDMVKKGGYLMTKDTLNMSLGKPIYMINHVNGYTGIYHDLDSYIRYFLDAGFRMYYEETLDAVTKPSIDVEYKYISWGAIWQKV